MDHDSTRFFELLKDIRTMLGMWQNIVAKMAALTPSQTKDWCLVVKSMVEIPVRRKFSVRAIVVTLALFGHEYAGAQLLREFSFGHSSPSSKERILKGLDWLETWNKDYVELVLHKEAEKQVDACTLTALWNLKTEINTLRSVLMDNSTDLPDAYEGMAKVRKQILDMEAEEDQS